MNLPQAQPCLIAACGPIGSSPINGHPAPANPHLQASRRGALKDFGTFDNQISSLLTFKMT
jgi:hypothetical protein